MASSGASTDAEQAGERARATDRRLRFGERARGSGVGIGGEAQRNRQQFGVAQAECIGQPLET